MKDKPITVREASTILSCHDDTVRKLIKNFELRAAKRFNKWVLWESDVRKYAKRQEPTR